MARIAQRLGARGAHHEAYIRIPRRPAGFAQFRNLQMEIVFDLQLRCAGIRSQAERDHPLARESEKRLDAIRAEIGADGRGVAPQPLEKRARVAGGGVADVAALGVENHGNLRRDQGARAFQRLQALAAQGLKKRQVRLVGADEIACGFDDRFRKLEDSPCVA